MFSSVDKRKASADECTNADVDLNKKLKNDGDRHEEVTEQQEKDMRTALLIWCELNDSYATFALTTYTLDFMMQMFESKTHVTIEEKQAKSMEYARLVDKLTLELGDTRVKYLARKLAENTPVQDRAMVLRHGSQRKEVLATKEFGRARCIHCSFNGDIDAMTKWLHQEQYVRVFRGHETTTDIRYATGMISHNGRTLSNAFFHFADPISTKEFDRDAEAAGIHISSIFICNDLPKKNSAIIQSVVKPFKNTSDSSFFKCGDWPRQMYTQATIDMLDSAVQESNTRAQASGVHLAAAPNPLQATGVPRAAAPTQQHAAPYPSQAAPNQRGASGRLQPTEQQIATAEQARAMAEEKCRRDQMAANARGEGYQIHNPLVWNKSRPGQPTDEERVQRMEEWNAKEAGKTAYHASLKAQLAVLAVPRPSSPAVRPVSEPWMPWTFYGSRQ